ncbi:MAG: hypothetical protein ACTSQE_12420 [Candidatus Heimdallarchaeaceae archaeon]
MTEEAKQEDVKEQEEGQEVVAPAKATKEQPEQKDTSAEVKPAEGSKEYNWRKMEQRVNNLESEKHRLEGELQNKADVARVEAVDEFAGLQSDDLITYGQVGKLADKKAREIVKEELAAAQRAALPEQTKSKYADYDQVVTTENIEKLVLEDPDLEHDIKVSKNPYDRAYKAIRQADFYRKSVENKANSERIKANSEKPVSSNTVGKQGPLSQANAFATWSKEDLLKEMSQCSKKATSVPNLR